MALSLVYLIVVMFRDGWNMPANQLGRSAPGPVLPDDGQLISPDLANLSRESNQISFVSLFNSHYTSATTFY